jgi:hypothetical protein
VAPVEFVCVASRQRDSRAGLVTIHQNAWAYCDGAESHEHQWRTTGGVALEELRARTLVYREPAPSAS